MSGMADCSVRRPIPSRLVSARLATLFLVGTASLAASNLTYTWSRIDTSAFPNGTTFGARGGISENGYVAGDVNVHVKNGNDYVAFAALGAAAQSLGTLGGSISGARDVNAAGQVVGFAQDTEGAESAVSLVQQHGHGEPVPVAGRYRRRVRY